MPRAPRSFRQPARLPDRCAGTLLAANGGTRYTTVRARTPGSHESPIACARCCRALCARCRLRNGSALATDFCVELTATEFNRRAERRGDDNACAGSHSPDIKAKARDRARDNANNAIAPQCLRNVTPGIAQRACSRVNLVANTSANSAWADSPPAPKPAPTR